MNRANGWLTILHLSFKTLVGDSGMAYLARKIARAKWEPKNDMSPDDIPADAVTADLRTKDNMLSCWRLDTDSNDDVRQVALALVTVAERIDVMDLVWIDHEALNAQGFTMSDTPGETPVESLRDDHVDLIGLTLTRLNTLSALVVESLHQGQYQRFSKKELTDIIIEAVQENRVEIVRLKDKVKAEVEKQLGAA